MIPSLISTFFLIHFAHIHQKIRPSVVVIVPGDEFCTVTFWCEFFYLPFLAGSVFTGDCTSPPMRSWINHFQWKNPYKFRTTGMSTSYTGYPSRPCGLHLRASTCVTYRPSHPNFRRSLIDGFLPIRKWWLFVLLGLIRLTMIGLELHCLSEFSLKAGYEQWHL